MIQVCYASQITSVENAFSDLRDILTEAKEFNAEHNINGVLYYGDGYFFQCLEGEEVDVDCLIYKITKDQRHKNMSIFKPKKIIKKNFADWSMKYVARNSFIYNFFKREGCFNFNPIKLSQYQIEQLLICLYDINETKIA